MRRVIGLVFILLATTALCFARQDSRARRSPRSLTSKGRSRLMSKKPGSGDTVPLGSVVATSAQSLVDIEFSTRNAIRLSENTTLVFNPRNLQTGSELRQGALTLVLKRLALGASGANFLVKTPSAVAGVRGTSFFMKVESPTSTYVCACNGVVQVLGSDGQLAKELVASHHKAVRIDTSGSEPRIADAPMLYHTDADLEAVAAAIGRKIDWNVVDR